MSRRLAVLVAMVAFGCGRLGLVRRPGAFEDDVRFLKAHSDAFVLSDGEAQVAVVPQYQGRVMTSTATGPGGLSFGWLNRELIASGERKRGMNPFGGEDRFWLGPEGGQFAIFFKKGDPFDLAHWQTPEPIDWGPWELVSRTQRSATFRRKMSLVNYSGTRFDLVADRTIRLLGPEAVKDLLGVRPGPGVRLVAYESDNRITNTGKKPWRKETGLLSIWILCMYRPSPRTVVVVPYKEGPVEDLGPIVNDAYFGRVPPERLKVERGMIYFKCDGRHRSKIGLGPRRARAVLGSYDGTNGVLTIAQYDKPEGVTDYVNSMWEIQEHPYAGDVVNSYNDGPPAPGKKPMGPFYEIESSSPAAALAPGQSLRHIHRTFHFVGPRGELDAIARGVLGVGLARIEAAFE